MHKKFDHNAIEKKWRERWSTEEIYETVDGSEKPKAYILDMFPYPSGEGLHVGHPKGYIATDIYSRYKRMTGHEVLHPMGWDAFGLPAENFAIKNKIHPRVAVKKNIERFKEQLSVLGLDYDWKREINTTDPEYYKWTQWIFIQLFKKGLAYESHEPINWCPSCQTGLANEDLDGGRCERCDSEVEKRPMRQWVLKIREYADRMLEDLNTLEWPEYIKEAQRNWIGRSEGYEIAFKVKDSEKNILVFTTRPDTLYGATYMVLAPEHSLVQELASSITNLDEVLAYIKSASQKTEIERTNLEKEKTGVKLEGITAINPANGEEVPVFVADYVLATYGTGAIMAVPAHDERDFAFAKKHNLTFIEVIKTDLPLPSLSAGTLMNSREFDGMDSEEAKHAIAKKVGGVKKTTYKIRDWVFSRQRYWGEPIPIIHCEKCGPVAVPEKELPVRLPDVEAYEPTGTGESPLAEMSEWVKVSCPTCGGPAKRETNTMPQWAGSSWYYLRFMDPYNTDELVSKEKEKYWAPVDVYVGGDHAVRHLIYARFWHKFLYDIGVVSTIEPFQRLEFLGFILAEDGRKMSKRWGNVINPNDIVNQVGADTLRVYEMFMGPFENTIAWSTNGLVGARRFVERVWRMPEFIGTEEVPTLNAMLHKTIKKVESDIEHFKFNTAISQMMIFLNEVERHGTIGADQYKTFLKTLAPFAPHLAEELWELLGEKESVHRSLWPQADQKLLEEESIQIGVQVDGKVRASITITSDMDEGAIRALAENQANVATHLAGKEIARVIYVPRRIFGFITKG